MLIAARCKFIPHIALRNPKPAICAISKKTIVFGITPIHSRLGNNNFRSFAQIKKPKAQEHILDYAKNGQLPKAIEYYSALVKKRPPKDLSFYNDLLQHSSQDLKFASTLWYDMLKHAGTSTLESVSLLSKVSNTTKNPLLADSVIDACQSFGLRLNPGDCLELLHTYKNTKNVTKAMNLWRLMKSWDVLIKHKFYKFLFKFLESVRAKEEAIELYQHMSPQTKQYLQPDLLFAFKNLGCPALAEEVFRELPNKSEPFYNAMICVAGTESFEKAFQIYTQMSQNGLQPNRITLTTMMDICRRHQRLTEAVQFYQIIKQKGWMNDVITQTAVLEALFGTQDTKLMEEAFSLIPNPAHWHWARMQALYDNNGQWEKSLDCFKNIHPSYVNAYLLAFHAATELNLPNELERIHKQGQQNLYPIPLTFTVDAIAAYGKLKMAAQVLSTFESTDPKPAKLREATIVALSAIDFPSAYQVYSQALSEKMLGPAAVAAILRDVPTLEQGRTIHEHMKTNGQLPSVSHSLMRMYSKFEQPELAAEVFSQVSKSADPQTFHIIIEILSKHDRPDDVMKIFSEMQQQRLPPWECSIHLILDACKALHQVSQVMDMMDEFKDSHPQIHWQNHAKIAHKILHTYTRIDMLAAEIFWDTYQKFLNQNHAGAVANEEILINYRTMMWGYLRAQQPHKALPLWKNLLDTNPGVDMDTIACGMRIAGMLQNTKLGEQVLSLATRHNLITDKAKTVATLYYGRTKQTEKAKELLHQGTSSVFDYTALISSCSAAEAWNLFNEMLAKGIQPNPVTINRVLCALFRSDQIEKAESIFFGMKEKFGFDPDELLMRDMAIWMVKKHRWEAVLKVATQLNSPDLYLYIMVMCKNCLLSKTEDADLFLSRAETAAANVLTSNDDKAHIRAYRLLATIYQIAKRDDKAQEVQAKLGNQLGTQDDADQIQAAFAQPATFF